MEWMVKHSLKILASEEKEKKRKPPPPAHQGAVISVYFLLVKSTRIDTSATRASLVCDVTNQVKMAALTAVFSRLSPFRV